MVINFIYIDKYRGISNQNLNFSNQFVFNYNKESAIIEVDEKDFFIPDFYGDSIKNLTAIVGENGTGKTTILDFITYELLFPKYLLDDPTISCIISVYDCKEKINHLVYVGIDKAKIKIKNKLKSKIKSSNIRDFAKANKELWGKGISVLDGTGLFSKTVFMKLSTSFDYSFHSDYGPKRNPQLINLSTNYMLRYPNREYPINTLGTDDVYRAINFLAAGEDKYLPEINYPANIEINLNDYGPINFISNSNDYLASTVRDPGKGIVDNGIFMAEILRKLRNSDKESKMHKKTYIEALLVQYFLIDLVEILDNTKIKELFQKLTINTYKNVFQFIKSRINTNKNFLKANSLHREGIKSNWTAFIDSYEKLNESLMELLGEEMLSLAKVKDNNDIRKILIPITLKNKKRIKQLMDYSNSNVVFHRMIRYSWGNHISTGEQGLLYQFSRFYDFSKQMNKSGFKSLIVLIDEGELYMHPSWQLRYLNLLISFINRKFKGIEVQLILTSHSPFIISDLLKENVVFLKKSNDGTIISTLDEMEQTFAANIHVLFTDSFFMKNGTIGEFAKSKIDEIAEILINKSYKSILDLYPDIEKRISMIGEPVIKNKLLSMLADKFPFAMSDFDKRLKKVETHVSNRKRKK